MQTYNFGWPHKKKDKAKRKEELIKKNKKKERRKYDVSLAKRNK